MKATFMGIKRFDGRNEASPIPDSGQHAKTRMLVGRS
jgi:hypothetical protein